MALDVTGNLMTIQVNRKTNVISTDRSVNITKSDTQDETTFDLSVPQSSSHWVDGEAEGSVRTTTSEPESEEYKLGTASVAEGHNTKASGDCAHAEGEGSDASGHFSHAEGSATISEGTYSHAEGSQSEALGDCAHAEGFSTHATGIDSHAEGSATNAEGDSSHAEGASSHAEGYSSHAEGDSSHAVGSYAHAEGFSTLADGAAAHAEGYNTTADGNGSHAEGENTLSCSCSHAEGASTLALGLECHTEGYETVAASLHSHAEGTGVMNQTTKGYSVVSRNGNEFILDGNVQEDFVFSNALAIPLEKSDMSYVGHHLFDVSGLSYDPVNDQTTLTLSRLYPYGYFRPLADTITKISFLTHGAYGQSAHSEGTGTWAQAADSHTEGSETIAVNEREHACGRLNLPIKADPQNDVPGTLFTIGNGYYDENFNPVRRNAFDVREDGSIYAPQLKQGGGTLQPVSLDENGQLVLGGGDAGGSMTELTAAELRTLVANSGLTAGTFYRITDYQCTRTDFSNSQNATHQFDIILLAMNANTLNQKGWCIRHEGDTYFSSVHMSQWQVWYDLALDTYGRVLRLIDENRNDCPYDFKNVMWLHPTDNAYYYTFSVVSGSDVSDHSFNGTYCYGNIMGAGCHHIIFKNTQNQYGCSSNTFGHNCSNNTFGNGCSSNTFGNNCSNNTFDVPYDEFSFANTFGHNCSNNTFEDACVYNTFGNNCSNNTLRYSAHYNKFGDNCSNNTLGPYTQSNTFGDICSNNTFGNGCSSNTFGDSCDYNTFGDSCSKNTFGDNCERIIFGSSSEAKTYYRYIRIDDGNRYIRLDCTGTLSYTSYYQNVHIGLGVNNTTTYKTITDSNVNQTYQTEYLPTNSVTINV